ncbi:MAG TPA: hypothetical protein VFR58_04185 [Flavisolibacter sp.]|nr:hypothetical protein [Flavisolibacter sp.]
MARVFNICFTHEGKSYTALVFVSGREENNSSVKVTSNEDSIQVVLPSGRLIFPIAEVLKQVMASQKKGVENSMLYITEHISLQILSAL